MLFKFWQWVQFWLPFGLLIKLYKSKKAIPSNIKTRSGRSFKAVLINNDFGILFSDDKYIEDRIKHLVKKKKLLDLAHDSILNEMNSLSFNSKQELYELMQQGIEEIE